MLSVVMREAQREGSMTVAWLIFIPKEEKLSCQLELHSHAGKIQKLFQFTNCIFPSSSPLPHLSPPSSWASAAKTPNPDISTEWFASHLQAATWSPPSKDFLPSNWIIHGATSGTLQKQGSILPLTIGSRKIGILWGRQGGRGTALESLPSSSAWSPSLW